MPTPDNKRECCEKCRDVKFDHFDCRTSTCPCFGNGISKYTFTEKTLAEFDENNMFFRQWESIKGTNRELLDHIKFLLSFSLNAQREEIREKMEGIEEGIEFCQQGDDPDLKGYTKGFNDARYLMLSIINFPHNKENE